MATEDITLHNAGEYYLLAAAGEDFYASNASSHTIRVRSSASKPEDNASGHPANPSGPIVPDPAFADDIWIMCADISGAVVVKN